MTKENVKAQLCVIGGGMAGICAAVAAARRGVRTVLMHDRPVLGGNASSEVRMWVRGASIQFPDYREGGIIEEIAMRNTRFNPTMSYGVWDGVLFDLVAAEPNLRLLLNTTCTGAAVQGGRIVSADGWQLTTYKRFTVEADYFADCSGDGILTEFTSAAYTVGRESRAQTGEPSARETADRRTMGSSCLIQARETDRPVPFTPPPFAKKLRDEQFAHRLRLTDPHAFERDNFWWLELGGDRDTLRDAESVRDELLATAYGVWDYIKNSGRFDSERWELEWIGCLPAKRESRRYEGDYVLTESDLLAGRVFDDEIAYGGWPMDDHDPRGFATADPPNRNIRMAAPYAIPYRCLYSRNTDNLWFAGRNVSVTHMALSSTRVMATCALMGQAVGTACAVAVRYGCDPRGVGGHMSELQQMLREDDCYLLHTPRRPSAALAAAACDHSLAGMRAGIERRLSDDDPSVTLALGEPFTMTFPAVYAPAVRVLLDNDIAGRHYADDGLKHYPLRCNVPLNAPRASFAPYFARAFAVEIQTDDGWQPLYTACDNWRRLVRIPVGRRLTGLRFTGRAAAAGDVVRLLSLDIVS